MTPARRVAVIRGGPAREHDVSLASGAAVAGALRARGVEVVDVTVGRDLRWALGASFVAPATPATGPRGDVLAALDEVDVAFLALHGPWGEDGTVQGLLESFGVPYTGSGVFASALAMDKPRTKAVVAHAGVRVPDGIEITAQAWTEQRAGLVERIRELRTPLVVKPGRDGSSFGIELAADAAGAEAAVERAFEHSAATLLVEQRIIGVEVTCPVLGNSDDELATLPLVEIVPRGREFFDYQAKYEGASDEICPARVDETLADDVRGLGLRAHTAIGCDGLSRTDFVVDDEGRPWFLETNTIPGMTPSSLCPLSARTAGVSFDELCLRVVELALRRSA